jgi:dipeptidase E
MSNRSIRLVTVRWNLREDMPDTSLANIEKWASGIPVPTYAIDDETAIKVIDGTVEVVSEGNWKLFNP